MWFGLSSGDIACYNIESCQPAGSWSAHKSPVTSLITVDSVTVWSGTDIGEMKVWKMKVRILFFLFFFFFFYSLYFYFLIFLSLVQN